MMSSNIVYAIVYYASGILRNLSFDQPTITISWDEPIAVLCNFINITDENLHIEFMWCAAPNQMVELSEF